MTLDDAVALLLRYYQHGLADNARQICNAILAAAPGHPVATRYRDYLDRPAPGPDRPTGFTLIWQTDRTTFDWSGDWVRGLLAHLAPTEIVDGEHVVMVDRAIIVDHKLDTAKRAYYRTAFARGHRFGLLHLGDEGYADDTEAYRHCDFVIRNYWSVFHLGNPRILTVALGHKGGLCSVGAVRAVGERPHLWSFAGDPNKSSRQAMLDALSPLGPHAVHLTSAFFDPNALGPDAYRRLLEDSVFAPCPCGFINLDSFRIYESLECGCIPIVERRSGYDYFTNLFGPHPMITVTDWQEARGIVTALAANPTAAEQRRIECASWWARVKADHRRDIALLAHRATAAAPRCPTVPALW
jgi:hypothetical protein